MRNLTKCSQAAALLAGVLCAGLTVDAATKPKLTTIYDFAGSPDGAFPAGNPVADSSGNLYVAPEAGGEWASGAVSQLKLSGSTWSETVLYSFTGGADGWEPSGTLTVDSKGNIYGTTLMGGIVNVVCPSGCGVVFELSPPISGTTWTETVLYSFTGALDGASPNSGLVFDSNGNLYGTATNGGPVNPACGGDGGDLSPGCGVAFELTPPASGTAWTENVLYSFTAADDGGYPSAGLIFDKKGNLYGVAKAGGPPASIALCTSDTIGAPAGCGTVFELAPPASGSAWTETVLYSFTGASDGLDPASALTFDAKGNLYGSAYFSDEVSTPDGNYATGTGTIFQLAKPAKGTNTWTFSLLLGLGGKKGSYPFGELMINAKGTIYGATNAGGAKNQGVIYQLTPPRKGSTKWTELVLYNFTGKADGSNPLGGVLLMGTSLFGTTTGSGGTSSSGTVFELVP